MSRQIPIPGRCVSKAEYATQLLNEIINLMIEEAGPDFQHPGQIKKYAYLSVLGYGNNVHSLLDKDSDNPIDIATLEADPVGLAMTEDGQKIPYWIEPDANGFTVMAQAFWRAKGVVENWLKLPQNRQQAARKECFPPIVINITDADINPGDDPVTAAQAVMQTGSDDGKTLVMNCHIAGDNLSTPCLFPVISEEVKHLDGDGMATQLFQMSSVIPEMIRENAPEALSDYKNIPPGSRCFVYKARYQQMIQFLQWGTLGK
jgi:hypothetical protein